VTQKRKLGMMETFMTLLYEAAGGTAALTAAVRVSGPLTADLIKQSLTLLQKRHPLLRATLSKAEDGSDWFEVDENPQELPLEIRKRKGPGNGLNSMSSVSMRCLSINSAICGAQLYCWMKAGRSMSWSPLSTIRLWMENRSLIFSVICWPMLIV
jgi:hypothetical protein